MPFTRIDVGNAIKQMNTIKARDFNRMPKLLYEKYWKIIWNEFTHFCLQVLNYNVDTMDFNSTIISLIPKGKEPKIVTKFRPIGLYNVLYRISTKCITNRIKNILPRVRVHLYLEDSSMIIP